MEATMKNALSYDRELPPASMDSVVCPKPKRFGNYGGSPCFRLRTNNRVGISDLEAVTGLLDIIHAKGKCENEGLGDQISSCQPFFRGSPPSRVSNPIIQDDQFGTWRCSPLSPGTRLTRSPAPARKGGSSVTVRIEGFHCPSRDWQNCGISAVA